MTKFKSLLHSYLLLKQKDRRIDSAGDYSEGVSALGRALKQEYGVDVFREESIRAALAATR